MRPGQNILFYKPCSLSNQRFIIMKKELIAMVPVHMLELIQLEKAEAQQ
jgi:hypothetical protein